MNRDDFKRIARQLMTLSGGRAVTAAQFEKLPDADKEIIFDARRAARRRVTSRPAALTPLADIGDPFVPAPRNPNEGNPQ
jgi:hypothetical protein